MLQLGLIGCVFLAGLPSSDEMAIRKLAQQFAEARVKKDRAGMERVLHTDYLGYALPGRWAEKDEMGRAAAIAMWLNPDRVFRDLEYKTLSVRVHGGTAIETGEMRVDVRWKGAADSHTFGGVRFLRVWMKGKDGWRVAHESY